MTELAENKDYVVVIQCQMVVEQVCPGFLCEHAFSARTSAFARYPAERAIRYLPISCGGCPGRAPLRKLMNLRKNLKKRENIDAADIVAVHLSSCVTRSNHHGPRCPHIDYIKEVVARAGFDCVEDSRVSPLAEKRRRQGMYADPPSGCGC